MKFTLSWLKDHLDTDEPLEKLADKLTMIGLEVENIEDKAKALKPFTIAKVISAEQHPNADRLRVCMVDTGDGGAPVQVVCGAPNARTGLVSVFSPPGTYIPGKDITLGVGTIRGVESRGMLCSAAELQISNDHDGIMELPADAPIGAGYAEWAALGDPVIEINLTPNRQDCTGVHGIARDLAAADMGKFKDPTIKPIKGEFPCPVKVTVEDATLCPGFALRLVRGVKNGPSPEWLQKRLTAIGLRPINALVDITNFMTYDRARPLHVFDAKKVKGNLVVRRARDGETLLALDGRTYNLDPAICVIADEHGVESLAGIMGGEASGCDENTTDVLIESALWNEINIAQTGRKLGINSDARYRFERGVDPAFMVPGLELATKLVMETCGGAPSENVVVGKAFGDDRVIDFPVTEVKRLSGIEVPQPEMKRILTHLGFMMAGPGPVVKVAVPSWRTDVHGKADIVEEIVRIYGVDKVPMTPFERGEDARKPVLTPLQLRTRRARRALASRGIIEAVTWSFITKSAATLFGGGQRELEVANPIASDLSDMRPTLLAGLIAAAQANADRGFGDVALFEVGQLFKGDRPQDQFMAASGVRRGFASSEGLGRHWSGSAQAELFDAKADALAVLAVAGAPMQALQIVAGGPAWLHPGRSGTIQIGPQNVLGYFGEMHPRALETLGADGPLMVFEVILDRIPEAKKKPTRAKPLIELSAFQPVSRDFAFIVDRTVKAGDIVRAAQGVDKKLITGVNVFDVYEGKGIDDGKKSIAIAVTIQPREKTLTDQEIEAVAGKIVAEVAKKTGGVLRG
ncbi:phenylalanyl-tRNA synthetase beta chain [Bradyrhizobium japonicum]|uniref:phenylalanine--tRNA ligase subunit beta n=1 Tax=Bradyrhizobium TaxID=374 RepID=UPI0003FB1DBB|nr:MULTISPECIES: phenylalanine--tRNA ligase subunit beta [Bradyrhizobium]MBR0879012.1 phenylalanine--tRNA ligase subunit beta [Bradyrhizobium liaoningense]MBR0943937.1 phenylalanine--tRNA ligase subunit beta [Bradyrhizobium liaoningense]MBR0997420.1 phenylalanine--tRNA ligase subunit beta [Bradyrhizobium liaoningense]MBR1031017.1 phenylalanine--tRNA ligase subunit beta [Bradyrhizobium liaoningense]MBR1064100.1 phenylalanine--tRNA ligase subunit beta [Bradyrhizobium liaoningense]